MSAPQNKILRWFFFRDIGYLISSDQSHTTSCDCPSDRWRFLCWVILSMVFLSKFQHTMNNFIMFLSCIALLYLAINLLTLDLTTSIFAANFIVPVLALAIVSVLIIALETPTYHNYKFLVQKFVLREYHSWKHWCPDTYVMVVSVSCLTCIIRGSHKRLVLEWRKWKRSPTGL